MIKLFFVMIKSNNMKSPCIMKSPEKMRFKLYN